MTNIRSKFIRFRHYGHFSSTKLAKSWRNPGVAMKATENAWSTLPAGALISMAGKVLEAPPFSVSRAINQEPKTSWVAVSPVHTDYHAHALFAHASTRVSTCPGPPFHLLPIRRINALRLPFTRETHPEFLPHSVRMRPPAPIRDSRAIMRCVDERKRERRFRERVIRSSGP